MIKIFVMKKLFLLAIILSNLGCMSKDDFPIRQIEDRKTLTELTDVPAFLDVEKIEGDSSTVYLFSLHLMNTNPVEILSPSSNDLICDFLNEQMKNGINNEFDCAYWGYFFLYLRSNLDAGNYRLHVRISGLVKERNSEDQFTGKPIVLKGINKISSCTVEIPEKPGSFKLENNFWRLIGFTDEGENIISTPTCENPEIGIIFHDEILNGLPIDEPDAKSFTIKTRAERFSEQMFKVYSIDSNGKIFISRAINPSWMPPRPSTAPSNNYAQLTKDIYNKYDSLNQILWPNDRIDFKISNNKLVLFNPSNNIGALLMVEETD